MSIQIISPGALTTVQDYGRVGFCEIGFSPSGAVDTRSMELANILVGNEMGEAVLECTIIGPTIYFTRDNVIAVTGAYMAPRIDGREIPMNRAVTVKTGETLSLGTAETGCRTYIAFAGGLAIKKCFGSKSTDIKCGIGGVNGRPIKAGDEIEFANPVSYLKGMEKRVHRQMEAVALPKTIRVIMGPQDDYFTEEGIKTFLSSPYKLTNDSNRMACKLSGPVIASKKTTDIISDGISLGSIQVSINGQPIVMLSDRQTTGGYAKIATVISADIPNIAQCKPGDSLLFQSVSLETAHKLYKQRVKSMKKLQQKMR
ncbi:MAG: Biotin-dependent carboxylase-like putative protein [Lachnoclostridium sp.]